MGATLGNKAPCRGRGRDFAKQRQRVGRRRLIAIRKRRYSHTHLGPTATSCGQDSYASYSRSTSPMEVLTKAPTAPPTLDLTIPTTLQQSFGHADCGIYAEVVSGGDIAVGDPVGSE